MDSSILKFFSDRNVELISYIKRGEFTIPTPGYTAVVPDVPIAKSDWRVYGSFDGGVSWVSDSSPVYDTGATWDLKYQIGIGRTTASNNTIDISATNDGTTQTVRYILVGLIRR